MHILIAFNKTVDNKNVFVSVIKKAVIFKTTL